MGVYLPNMEKPKRCGECDLWSNCFYPKNPYTEKDDYIADDCSLIEIDDTVWENKRYELIRMTQAERFNKAMAERRADE